MVERGLKQASDTWGVVLLRIIVIKVADM